MRFDYHPPTTKFKSFHLRRLFLTCMILTGIGCIVFTLFTDKTNYYNSNVSDSDIKRPVLLSNANIKTNADRTLSLNNTLTAQAKQQLALQKTQTNEPKWQTITVQVGDTLSKVFDKLDIPKITFKNLMLLLSQKINLKLYHVYHT